MNLLKKKWIASTEACFQTLTGYWAKETDFKIPFERPAYMWQGHHVIIFQPFKAYCTILVRHSNFRHQASPCVSPRESTQRRKVELWAWNIREFCLNADSHVTFRDLLRAVKLRHGTNSFTSPPKEGVLRIFFFAIKIRRLQPGANARNWVPKASTLPLDHRSRLGHHLTVRRES